MALNLNGKKTSLKEEAEIYKKRSDRETEHEKLKKMDGRQKLSYFTSYYLPILLIALAVAAIAGYLFWSDVLNKRDILIRCAVINEPIPDSTLTEFGDNFVASVGEDPDKKAASFYVYYTRSDIASETGANPANDLSEITSRIVAADLGCMIADEPDGKNYLDNGFFLNMKDFLSKEEYDALEDCLYIVADGEKIKAGAYGIYLESSSVYQGLIRDLPASDSNPVFSVITNSENESRDYAKKLIHYLFPDRFS